MSLQDHLGELRIRLLRSLLGLLLFTGLGFWQSDFIIQTLTAQAPKPIIFVQLALGEVLNLRIQLAVLVGVLLSLPYGCWELQGFLLPGLKAHEQRLVSYSLWAGLLLFGIGVATGYYLFLTPTIAMLADFGQSVAKAQLSIGTYCLFCVQLLLFSGLALELPLVLFALAALRVINSAQLLAHWRGMVVGMFLLSAVITPTQDPWTMLAVGVLLCGLCALSIVPIRVLLKR